MSNKTSLAGWWLLAGLLFGCASVTGVLLVKEIEHRMFPVVSDFEITRSERTPNGVLIWGTFEKERDCQFVEAVVLAGAISLDLEYLDRSKNKAVSRALGPQTFGPWRISPDLYPLRIVARHSCHPLWLNTTTLIGGYKP